MKEKQKVFCMYVVCTMYSLNRCLVSDILFVSYEFKINDK